MPKNLLTTSWHRLNRDKEAEQEKKTEKEEEQEHLKARKGETFLYD